MYKSVLLIISLCIVSVYTSDDDDIYELVNAALSKCDHNTTYDYDYTDQISVYFFNSSDSTLTTYSTLSEAINKISSASGYDSSFNHTFWFHGFKSSWNASSTQYIYAALSGLSDTYAFILSYEDLMDPLENIIKSYKQAVINSYYISKAVSSLVENLVDAGLNSSNIHIIGHSLGAHMAGYLGKIMYKNISVKPGRISAIDPAYPCFSDTSSSEELTSGDADYVVTFHCNADELGQPSVDADLDVYADCSGMMLRDCYSSVKVLQLIQYKLGLTSTCSHSGCVKMFAESIANSDQYTASKCSSYSEFIAGDCGTPNVTVGYFSSTSNTGVHFMCSSYPCKTCYIDTTLDIYG